MTETARVDSLDSTTFADFVDDAARIYGAAMQRRPEVVIQRREIIRSHLRHPGFVATMAFDGADEPVGFGYGYRGAPGQWWYDAVSAALGRQESRHWLHDGFELAELHVLPAHQGAGIGSRLLDAVLGRVDTTHALLSTPDAESPARRLYRSRQFVDILREFYFPGSPEAYAVMGARLRD